MTVPKLARGACKWMPALEHLFDSSTTQARKKVVCCGCDNQVEHQHSWATVPYGRNGIRLPLPVFLFCGVCRVSKDATEEWMRSYQQQYRQTP